VVGGVVAREGEQVVIGDIGDDAGAQEVRYQVLCRRHHRAGDLGPAAVGGGDKGGHG
jgi:thymidine kinase